MKGITGKTPGFVAYIFIRFFLFVFCAFVYCVAAHCNAAHCNAAHCNCGSYNTSLCSVQDGMLQLNFDKIFPETPLKNVFDSCAKVYQELDLARASDFFSLNVGSRGQMDANFDIFTDLLVGKLFNIKVGISKVPEYHEEDVAYLNNIFDKILLDYQTTCASCTQFSSNPKSENIPEIIKEIKSKLHK